jgi:hypothetical protein
MTTQTAHSIDVPRVAAGPISGFLDLKKRRARRHALTKLRALEAVGEPCTYRIVLPDRTAVAVDQVTDRDFAEIREDLEHLSAMHPAPLEVLLRMLYAASSHSDRSRLAPALDCLLAYVSYWSTVSPSRVAALFERLDPSRLVRAVGQTLLASTQLVSDRPVARQKFLARFLEHLRARNTPEAVIARLREGLEM